MSQDWIKPGAEIAVYTHDRYGKNRLQQKKIATVAAKSFTVEGITDRFRLDTMAIGRCYKATRPGSEEALAVADRDNRNAVRSDARAYLHNDVDSLKHVDEAIKSLQEWRALLVAEATSDGAS
jgi:hypothetical protein